MFEGFNFNIRIQVRPMKLGRGETLQVENLLNGGALKNRVVREGHEVFPIVH